MMEDRERREQKQARPDDKPPFYFDAPVMAKLAAQRHVGYREAQPFPHVIIDNFLPEPAALSVLEEFPVPSDNWRAYKDGAQVKLASEDVTQMGPMTRHLLAEFNSGVFLTFLEKLTGIEPLLPDPYFRGGGLHQIKRGGYLKVHADFNFHPKLKVDRRLNLLLYLNREWEESYGGHLQLWDRQMKNCVVSVLPVFNRCVIFSTTDESYHGHPEPLTTPEGVTRKSLALYYYSSGRPSNEASAPHSTLFQKRPGEEFNNPVEKSLIRQIAPPIVLDAARYIKRKLRR